MGEILVSLEQAYIKQFDEYFTSLDWNTNKRNPWFSEFWQDHFKCELDPYDGSEHPECSGIESCFCHVTSAFFHLCNFEIFSGDETLADGYKQNPKVPYVIESVFVLAHALHNMLQNGCEDVHAGKLSMKNAFYKSCYMVN